MSQDTLEVIVEPDVVPKGTVDLRAIPTASAETAPPVRTSSSGRVVERGLTTQNMGGLHAAVSAEAAETGSLRLKEPPEPKSSDDPPTLIAVESAASAPIPPRPAAAAEPAPVAVAAGEDDEEFDTDLGGGFATAWTLTKVLLYLLLLTAMVGALGLHLAGVAPWQEEPKFADAPGESDTTSTLQIPDVAISPRDAPSDPGTPDVGTPDVGSLDPTPPDDPAPDDPAPVDPDPVPVDPQPEPDPVEPEPVDPDPVEPDPIPEPDPIEGPVLDPETEFDPDPSFDPDAGLDPELALMALKILAEGSAAGGEFGVEEDRPGLLAQIEGLRAQAVRSMQSEDYGSALTSLEQLLELNDGDADAWFRVGLAHHRQGSLSKARSSYERAASFSPGDPRAWNNLGVLALVEGDHADAEARFQRALQEEPHDADALSNLASLREDDTPEAALALYDQALAHRPEHGPARLGRARVHAAMDMPEAARADYLALVEAGSAYAPQALDALGVQAQDRGEWETAQQLHRQALERAPTLTPARINLGVALLEGGSPQQAAAELERAVREQPRSAKAWQVLGITRSRLAEQRPDLLYDAKDAYESALRLDANDWVTRYNYGLCAERFGNFLFAIRQYEAAVELEPGAWEALANLARLYDRGGEREKALQFVERALEHAEDEPDLHLHRARLLAQLDRSIEARNALRRFVEVADPSDPRLESVRRGLTTRGQ